MKVVLAALVMAGAWSTVSVNAWVVRLDGALLAVIVMLYTPPVPAEGVPLSVAVPLVPAVKLTPLGRFPLSLSVVVAGIPGVVVIVKLPGTPTVKVVLAAPVMTGGVRLAYRQREGLHRLGRHAVVGNNVKVVGSAACARGGRAAQRGLAVTVVHKSDAAGQAPVLAERRRRVTRGRDREAAGGARREGGARGAGDDRRRWCRHVAELVGRGNGRGAVRGNHGYVHRACARRATVP